MKVIPSTAFGSVRTIIGAEYYEDKYKQYDYTNFKQEELADVRL